MIPVGHLLTFAVFAFLLIIAPGPNVMFVISRTLVLGRAAGIGTAVGGQLGVYVQVMAVAFGARAWFARWPRRLAFIGGTGGLAMIGLGAALAVTGRRD